MTFGRWEGLTPDLPGSVRADLFRYVAERHEADCSANLAWQAAEHTEWERQGRPIHLDEDEPRKRRSPHHGTPTSTSTGSLRVALPDGDLLKQIPANQYLPAFTGEVVSAAGRTRCPSPDHPDVHPSTKCYGTRWTCFSCGAGGTIVDAGELVSGIPATGASYFELRAWIMDQLGLGVRP